MEHHGQERTFKQCFLIVLWCVDSRIVHKMFPTLKNDHSHLPRWEGEEQTKPMGKFIMWPKNEFGKFRAQRNATVNQQHLFRMK